MDLIGVDPRLAGFHVSDKFLGQISQCRRVGGQFWACPTKLGAGLIRSTPLLQTSAERETWYRSIVTVQWLRRTHEIVGAAEIAATRGRLAGQIQNRSPDGVAETAGPSSGRRALEPARIQQGVSTPAAGHPGCGQNNLIGGRKITGSK